MAESSNKSFSFGSVSQSSTGSNSINQVGDNQASINVGSQPAIESKELQSILNMLETTVLRRLDEHKNDDGELMGLGGCLALEQEAAVNGLRTLSALPNEQLETPEAKSLIKKFCETLADLSPVIINTTTDFSLEVLRSLTQTNPIVSGLIAICKSLRESVMKDESEGEEAC